LDLRKEAGPLFFFAAYYLLVSCVGQSSNLKMEVLRFCETLVELFLTIQYYIAEHSILFFKIRFCTEILKNLELKKAKLYVENNTVIVKVPHELNNTLLEIESCRFVLDRLCGLVVRVLGYRSGGPGSIPGTTRIKKVVGLERGPLSLVSTTEEILDRKVAAPV
jgi:hypothetical protein